MCFEYDGYAEMYEARTVVCRKPHRCEGCGGTIVKGESAELATGKFEGRLFAEYTCETCQRMILSIAAEEIRHGCHWNEAWCATSELAEYLSHRHGDPVPLLVGTLEECRYHVNAMWKAHEASKRAESIIGVFRQHG